MRRPMVPRGTSLSRRARQERQRSFWEGKYSDDPAFFGEEESEFARWCLPRLRGEMGLREIVELGCGYGRDTRFLRAEGFRVRGVDFAGVPRSEGVPPEAPLEFVEAECLAFLEREAPASVDAAYSNMFFNMDFTEAEHRRLFSAVRRILRPGGLHLYSVRATSDPWYGRGRRVGPDRFDPSPHGVTMHYFSKEYIDRLGGQGFEPVARTERLEGASDFPIRLWYVVDRKPFPPTAHGRARPLPRPRAGRSRNVRRARSRGHPDRAGRRDRSAA